MVARSRARNRRRPTEPPAAARTAASAGAPARSRGEASRGSSSGRAAAAPKSIEVTLQAKSGSKLTGKATLTETPDGVKVALSVENVKPGDHGAHVHEKGDCSANDGASAGGHFNPGSHPHALPSDDPRHLGDLGNITVGKDGKGTHEIVISRRQPEARRPELLPSAARSSSTKRRTTAVSRPATPAVASAAPRSSSLCGARPDALIT